MTLPPHRPPGWEEPKLTGFLESLWENSLAVFHNKREAHRVCRIDDVMAEISENWKAVSPTVEIRGLMKRAKELANVRNAVAHGLWIPFKEGGKLVHVPTSLKPNISTGQATALIKKAQEARKLRGLVQAMAENKPAKERPKPWR